MSSRKMKVFGQDLLFLQRSQLEDLGQSIVDIIVRDSGLPVHVAKSRSSFSIDLFSRRLWIKTGLVVGSDAFDVLFDFVKEYSGEVVAYSVDGELNLSYYSAVTVL